MGDFMDYYVESRDLQRLRFKISRDLFNKSYVDNFGEYARDVRAMNGEFLTSPVKALGRCMGYVVADLTTLSSSRKNIEAIDDRVKYRTCE